ncbi:MAG: hypothetical protein RIR00_666 [Pseudomonadota bacterium]
MSYIVGLTGGIGSGKTTVANLFAERGAAVVDTDQIAHELTAPGGAAMPQLVACFGPDIQRPDGAMDRDAMRRRVFADPGARQQLEGILHPAIRALADQRCAAALAPYVLLVVPLLIESGQYRSRCDRILVVDCPEEIQIARVMQRNGLGESEVRAIMAAQLDRQARRAAADDIISNHAGFAEVVMKVAELDEKYRFAATAKIKDLR